MRRLARLLAATATSVVALVAAGQTAATAAGDMALKEIPSVRFPERSYVLSLPTERALSARELRVTENGAEVHDLTVEPGSTAGGHDFGLVLAIDASNSMRGAAIDGAMAAARAFAERRQPDQPLGIVFFGGDVDVALEPTVESAKIDAALAAPPPLTHGTRLLDGTQRSVDLLERAGIAAGTVVVLSDGADFGSRTSPAALGRSLDRSSARVFSVGLRTASYDDSSLRSIAMAGGGDYAEATSSQRLEAIFDALGRRLANQYLLTYKSLAPLGESVVVRAEIAGRPGAATSAYQAPSLVAGGDGGRRDETPWTSPYAPVALSLLISAIVGLFTFGIVRPAGRGARSRIAGFVRPAETVKDRARRAREPSRVLRGARRTLMHTRAWAAFAEEVELARIRTSAARLAAWTLASTLGGAYAVGVLAGRPVLAAAVLGLPVGVWMFLRMKVNRERRAFGDQLAENLQVLASAMRAGHSFLGALTVMAKDAGEPARREFQRVIADERLGIPVEEALGTVARRMRNPDVEYVGLVAQLQTDTGGNTAEVLDRVTDTIRERNALRRLVATLTAQGRLGGWVVSLLPVGLIVALSVINPNYLDPLLETGSGKALFGVGIGCIVAGMLTIRKIVNIKI